MMVRFLPCVVASTLFSAVFGAGCNQTRMLEFAHGLVDAQNIGSLGNLDGANPYNLTYLENNRTMEITSGVLSKALHVDHNRTITDLTECATYTEMIMTDRASPHVVGTQVRHEPDNDMLVYLVDSVVSTTGSWIFNATKTLEWVLKEDWSMIPAGERPSRETLKSAADAYLDMWSNKSAIDAVPWGTPCARLEGSAYTGNGSPTDSCKPGIPTNNSQAPNINRRYVIDESFGSVDVINIFQHLANAPDSHEFRMVKGKLRYIHTMTIASSGAVPAM